MISFIFIVLIKTTYISSPQILPLFFPPHFFFSPGVGHVGLSTRVWVPFHCPYPDSEESRFSLETASINCLKLGWDSKFHNTHIGVVCFWYDLVKVLNLVWWWTCFCVQWSSWYTALLMCIPLDRYSVFDRLAFIMHCVQLEAMHTSFTDELKT